MEILNETAHIDEALSEPELLDKKAKAKAEKKRLKKEKKEARKVAFREAQTAADSFPMIKMIAEQVEKHVPGNVIDTVRAAKKKDILNPRFPYTSLLANEEYLEEMELLGIELVKLQSWAKETGNRIVILFEGRDAAGKGGTIKRFTENLNPRGARGVALTAPSTTEKGQWYFQRYVDWLPAAGEIVVFASALMPPPAFNEPSMLTAPEIRPFHGTSCGL